MSASFKLVLIRTFAMVVVSLLPGCSFIFGPDDRVVAVFQTDDRQTFTADVIVDAAEDEVSFCVIACSPAVYARYAQQTPRRLRRRDLPEWPTAVSEYPFALALGVTRFDNYGAAVEDWTHKEQDVSLGGIWQNYRCYQGERQRVSATMTFKERLPDNICFLLVINEKRIALP